MSLPGLSEVKAADWGYLRTNAAAWSALAGTWSSAFSEISDAATYPGGTTWEGDAAQAFASHCFADLVKIRGPADMLDDAAGIASRGADTQEAGRQLVLDAVDAAERDGFVVGEDYAVTDTAGDYGSPAEYEARQQAAQQHADSIGSRVHHLLTKEQDIARDLHTAADLRGFGFGDADGGAGAIPDPDGSDRSDGSDGSDGDMGGYHRITAEELQQIVPELSPERAQEIIGPLNEAMRQGGMNTPERQAAFISQLAVESDRFHTFEEYASGSDYEGRTDLGNTQPGDGERYKGRGAIQVTGRHNYTQMSEDLGVDFVNHPELAATPEYAFKSALWYWNSRDGNAIADQGDIVAISRMVNGGDHGLAERTRYYHRALEVLAR